LARLIPRLSGSTLWAATAALLVVAAFFEVVAGRTIVPIDLVEGQLPRVAGSPIRAENGLRGDVAFEAWPFREIVDDTLSAGALPLWTDRLGMGQPLLGNVQAAPLSPFTIFALPFEPLVALGVSSLLASLVAAAGGLLLARRLGADSSSSALAGLAFALSGWMTVWSGWRHAEVAAWLPLLLALLLDVVERPTRRRVAATAVVIVGCLLAGHPATVWQVVVAAGAIATLASWRRPRALLAVGVAVLLGAALAAPALVAAADAIPEGNRAAAVKRLIEAPDYRPAYLEMALAPFVYGSPRGATWSGPVATGVNFNELTSWPGAVPLVLALAGLVAGGSRLRWIVGVGIVIQLVAASVPGLVDLAWQLPGMRSAHPGRLGLLWILAATVAASLVLSQLSMRPRLRWVVVVLGGFELVWLMVSGTGGHPGETRWLLVTALGLGLFVGMVALRLPLSQLAAAALIVTAADLACLRAQVVPTFEPRSPVVGVVGELVHEITAGGGGRLVAEGRVLAPNSAAILGLSDPRVRDPMSPARVQRFLVSTGWGRGRSGTAILGSVRDVPPTAFDALDVRWFVGPLGTRPPPRWRRVVAQEGVGLWRSPGALGRFYLPQRIEVTPEIWQRLGEQADFAHTALVEEDQGIRPAGQEPGAVRVEAVANGFRLELEAPSQAPRVIASSVSWAPGWRAAAASSAAAASPARTIRVNGAFVGVIVPPGVVHVELDYRPRGWQPALAISIAALAMVGFFAWPRRVRDLRGN
jgi:hypothetical protein